MKSNKRVLLIAGICSLAVAILHIAIVIGRVNDNGTFTLESSKDIFSKRLVGYLKKDGNSTRIEAHWSIPFKSKIYGSHKVDEEEIIGFLKNWLKIEPITEQPTADDA